MADIFKLVLYISVKQLIPALIYKLFFIILYIPLL